MPYTPILATLGYIFSPDKSRVLLVHRIARSGDLHFGKYNGIGGKLERNEHIIDGFRREVREEVGISCDELHLAGTISWPGFGKNGEDWFAFIFRVTAWSGTPMTENPEGSLEWVPIEDVPRLPMWEGDWHFLPLVLDPSGPRFHGVMPYEDGRPIDWQVTILSG